jgi:hypothetical protein
MNLPNAAIQPNVEGPFGVYYISFQTVVAFGIQIKMEVIGLYDLGCHVIDRGIVTVEEDSLAEFVGEGEEGNCGW